MYPCPLSVSLPEVIYHWIVSAYSEPSLDDGREPSATDNAGEMNIGNAVAFHKWTETAEPVIINDLIIAIAILTAPCCRWAKATLVTTVRFGPFRQVYGTGRRCRRRSRLEEELGAASVSQ
jgi:hypothetical protein